LPLVYFNGPWENLFRLCWHHFNFYNFKLQVKLNKTYLTLPYLTNVPSPTSTLLGATFPKPLFFNVSILCQMTSLKVTKIWQNKFWDRQSTLVQSRFATINNFNQVKLVQKTLNSVCSLLIFSSMNPVSITNKWRAFTFSSMFISDVDT